MKLDDWYRARKADPDAMTAAEQALFDWLLEAELRGRLPKGRDNNGPREGAAEEVLDTRPGSGYA